LFILGSFFINYRSYPNFVATFYHDKRQIIFKRTGWDKFGAFFSNSSHLACM
jgi:hypothetical protein